MTVEGFVVLQVLLTAMCGVAVYLLLRRQRHGFGSVEEQATLRTLASATSTLSSLRRGLTAKSAAQVLRPLGSTAGAEAVALYDTNRLLAYHADTAAGIRHRGHAHGDEASILSSMAASRRQIVPVHSGSSDDCELRLIVMSPLVVNGQVLGSFVTYHQQTPDVATLRIASDLAELIATQLRLVEADQQTAALARAELRALRAQISPHFIYNTLTTIASFVRTDPARARELLTEFADFTRKAFRGPTSEYITLADELVYVHQYLLFEQARFGDRLKVIYKVEPEVLSTVIPALILQPLVENAVKHGLESSSHVGLVTIEAQDQDDECHIVVRDNGSGFSEKDVLEHSHGAVTNINQRLLQTFGQAHGLVVRSQPGGGTTVRVRVPKYRPGVRVS
ncbi:MAG: histidine kinase [Candidatus Dormibacteraeota bacterium]|nr:histidine kinase [Candidatus Dormibacteraeota bacterium]